MPVFNRGDIIRVQLNPTAGNEIQGDMRPCIVVSLREFNRLGLTIIAPITQGGNFARFNGFAVTLTGAGTSTQGVILANAIRSVDLNARNAAFVETAPSFIMDELVAILSAVIIPE